MKRDRIIASDEGFISTDRWLETIHDSLSGAGAGDLPGGAADPSHGADPSRGAVDSHDAGHAHGRADDDHDDHHGHG